MNGSPSKNTWMRRLTVALSAMVLISAIGGCGNGIQNASDANDGTASTSQNRQTPGAKEGEKKNKEESSSATQKTDTKKNAKEVPQATGEQVRAHAEDVSKQFSAQAGYTVPGDQCTVYSFIAQHGIFDTSGLTDVEYRMRDMINDSLHWDDSHTGEENQQRIEDLDSAYADWLDTMWKAMIECLQSTTDGLENQLRTMPSDYADSCIRATGMADLKPSNPEHTEAGYVALRDWMNNVINQLNQCQGDMAALHPGE